MHSSNRPARSLSGHAGRFELLGQPSQRDADLDAAAGEVVERREASRQHDRLLEQRDDDVGAQPNAVGLGRDPGERLDGVERGQSGRPKCCCHFGSPAGGSARGGSRCGTPAGRRRPRSARCSSDRRAGRGPGDRRRPPARRGRGRHAISSSAAPRASTRRLVPFSRPAGSSMPSRKAPCSVNVMRVPSSSGPSSIVASDTDMRWSSR